MYFAQKSRGMQGYGFVEIGKGKVGKPQRTMHEHEIMRLLQQATANEILFHHRWPTSTPNVPEAAHPIPVSHACLKYDYYGVHNGVIRNTEELKKKYEKLGFSFTTTVETVYRAGKHIYDEEVTSKINDSEFLMIDLALAIEKDKEALDSIGSIAFIMLQVEKDSRKPVKLFYGRNDNPLKINITADVMTLSSAGAGEDVEPHTLHSIDYISGAITVERLLEIGEAPKKTKVVSSSYMGQRYNRDLQCWENEVDPLEEIDFERKLAGFDTRKHIHHVALPLPKKVEKTATTKITQEDLDNLDENHGILDYDDVIPNISKDGLEIALTSGRKTYWMVSELEFDYYDAVDEIDYWEKRSQNNHNNKSIKDECTMMLDVLRYDLRQYETEIKNVCPELLESFKFDHEITKQTEPIL